LIYDVATGLEGGSRFARAKRFALKFIKVCLGTNLVSKFLEKIIWLKGLNKLMPANKNKIVYYVDILLIIVYNIYDIFKK